MRVSLGWPGLRGAGSRPHPRFLLQPGHHDDGGRALLPHHAPEVPEGLGQRPLRGDVRVLPPVAVHIVGVDIIAAHNACGPGEKPEVSGGAP